MRSLRLATSFALIVLAVDHASAAAPSGLKRELTDEVERLLREKS